MTQQFWHSIDGYTYVGCPTRLGKIVKTGPVSGRVWEITPLGSWIITEDAEVLTTIEEDVWCFKSKSYLKTYTVFYLNASSRQVAKLKSMLNGGQ